MIGKYVSEIEILLMRWHLLPNKRKIFCYKVFENAIELSENELCKKAKKLFKKLGGKNVKTDEHR